CESGFFLSNVTSKNRVGLRTRRITDKTPKRTTQGLATFTVLANVTVFVAMAQTLTRDIRRGLTTVARSSNNSYITRFLVLSMTTSGVIVGGFIMPLSLLQIINNGQWLFGYTLCVEVNI
uniref:Uncharacterized protein n=1 Tax=Biomphalaria glabrata TaxID=6526 RepID=A0A2C9LIZ5_BIOGL